MKSLFTTSQEAALIHISNHAHYANTLQITKALKPEQPIQCFSPRKLKEQIQLFTQVFNQDVAYAVKANPSPQIIKSAYDMGITTFDVASLAEIELITKNAPQAKIHYHNPIRSNHEIEVAFKSYNCKRFAIDDMDELNNLFNIIGPNPEIEIAVRFRLPKASSAIHDFSEKFGANQENAVCLLKQTKALGYKAILTFHPGSQCTTPQGWCDHIKAAASITQNANVKLDRLNIGGGFPVPYTGNKKYLLTRFFDAIKQATQKEFKNPPTLECEPGRAIVAPSISLITQVKAVRAATREVYINDGIYGSLLEMSQAKQLTPKYKVIRDGTYLKGPIQPFIVYGPTCDPLDRLPDQFELPLDIKQGDFIEFEHLGAYGAATTTSFNGYGTAEIVYVN